MKPAPQTQPSNPIEQALRELVKLRRTATLAMALPFLLSVAAVVAMRKLDPGFWSNPILAGVVALFLAGQILLVWQLWTLRRRTTLGIATLRVVEDAGDLPDARALEANLLACQPEPIRDLLLGWLHLERVCEGDGGAEMLQNSIDRRSLRDQMELSVHVMINRVVLKIGFLGTLVGLLMTFPPMKRAVLGLSGSDGEMSFIRDIAKAIDEDAYAIQATLVGTGFSLLLETLVVQVLERFFGKFELVESLLSDWNLAVLRRVRKASREFQGAGEDNLRLQAKLAQGQQILDAHLQKLLESLRHTGESVEKVARAQAALESRVEEIVTWEKEYRAFVSAKEKAAAPALRRVEV